MTNIKKGEFENKEIRLIRNLLIDFEAKGNLMTVLRRLKRKSFKGVTPKHKSITSNSSARYSIERITSFFANFSQIGLLILGVFGYFYTVVPVFQNQQLQEENAKLELEKKDSQNKIKQLYSQQEEISKNINLLQKKWKTEQSKVDSLQKVIAVSKDNEEQSKARELDARGRELDALNRISEATALLKAEEASLRKARWELVLFDFSFANLRTTLNSYTDFYNLGVEAYNAGENGSKDFEKYTRRVQKDWPKPYESLLSAVTEALNKREASNLPIEYYDELREYIKLNEKNLICQNGNLDSLRSEYKQDLNGSQKTIDEKLKEKIETITADYAKKRERVVIDDDFRSKLRNSVELGVIYSLNEKYRKKIDVLRKDCFEKSDQVIEHFYNSKGVTRR